MKSAILTLLVLLCASTVHAQDCVPTFVFGHTPWSTDPTSHVIADSNASHVFSNPLVPVGYVWKMRTISLSTSYGGQAEYMIEWLINVPGGHHYHEIARGVAGGTPALHVATADAAAMVMVPGERLAGRQNGSPTPGMFLMWSAWQFPAACLPRLLGVAAPSTATPVDLSTLTQAAKDAASALTNLAGSVPQ